MAFARTTLLPFAADSMDLFGVIDSSSCGESDDLFELVVGRINSNCSIRDEMFNLEIFSPTVG